MRLPQAQYEIVLKTVARANCILSISEARRQLHVNLERTLSQLLVASTTLPADAFNSVSAEAKRPFPTLEQDEFSRGIFQLAVAHCNAPKLILQQPNLSIVYDHFFGNLDIEQNFSALLKQLLNEIIEQPVRSHLSVPYHAFPNLLFAVKAKLLFAAHCLSVLSIAHRGAQELGSGDSKLPAHLKHLTKARDAEV